MKAQSTAAASPAYQDNILIEALGPILSGSEKLKRLRFSPDTVPTDVDTVPIYLREHSVMSLRRLIIPMPEGERVSNAIDIGLRQGYVDRNPRDPNVWQWLYRDDHLVAPGTTPPLAAYLTGVSGSGKTRAAETALSLYPQTVEHLLFPFASSPVTQLVWLRAEVPRSGKAVDLAWALMSATDLALGDDFFAREYKTIKRYGPYLMLEHWKRKVNSHFLGILVLDEASNLFRLQAMVKRQKKRPKEPPMLAVADDEALRFIVNLTNSARFPLLLIATPDGMNAFCSRMSTTQRLLTNGFYCMRTPSNADDLYFKDFLFPELCKYQWFGRKLPATDEFRRLVYQLTAGVPRILIALWVLAHRYCFSRLGTVLEFSDFKMAMKYHMGPLVPAVEALLSDDPDRLSRYEDLIPRQDEIWANLWSDFHESIAPPAEGKGKTEG